MTDFVFTVPGVVLRVVDGDTVDAELQVDWRGRGRRDERVRLIGFPPDINPDAPEKGTAAGKLAKAYVEGLLPVGAHIVVRAQKVDSFGRTLGTVQLPDGADLGRLLLAEGFAVPYTG